MIQVSFLSQSMFLNLKGNFQSISYDLCANKSTSFFHSLVHERCFFFSVLKLNSSVFVVIHCC